MPNQVKTLTVTDEQRAAAWKDMDEMFDYLYEDEKDERDPEQHPK